jgi:hypothetical protein
MGIPGQRKLSLSNPSQTRAKALQRRGATFVMPQCNEIGNFTKSFAPIRQQI